LGLRFLASVRDVLEWTLLAVCGYFSFFHCVCSNTVCRRSRSLSDRHLHKLPSVAATPAAFVLKGACRLNGHVPLLSRVQQNVHREALRMSVRFHEHVAYRVSYICSPIRLPFVVSCNAAAAAALSLSFSLSHICELVLLNFFLAFRYLLAAIPPSGV